MLRASVIGRPAAATFLTNSAMSSAASTTSPYLVVTRTSSAGGRTRSMTALPMTVAMRLSPLTRAVSGSSTDRTGNRTPARPSTVSWTPAVSPSDGSTCEM